ncbi:MAG: tripartite tricarboxylate transporter substrate binding protein [Burkholderiales bacterium]|nr:tripartite tricarboxylate transporter substrate binding protein [Burkholderiales bacterium]
MSVLRRFLCGLFALAAASAPAQPTGPIKLVVPAPAGSSADLVARALARNLSEVTGQPVSVDNRGETAAEVVAKAAPDGATLLFATPALPALIALRESPAFEGGLTAFAPIGRIANEPLVLVATSTLSVSSVFDLIAIAKASSGRINYASGGAGSLSHLAGELFKSLGTVQLAHTPAKSGEAALADVVSGRAKLMFGPFALVEPALRAGKVKALAVTGPARLGALPDVPTMREEGVLGFDFTGWFGVAGPAATPKATAQRLNADLRRAVQRADARDKLRALLGTDPTVGSPEELAALMSRDLATFAKLAKEMNLK